MARKDKSTLASQVNSVIRDNSEGEITAADVRQQFIDFLDSLRHLNGNIPQDEITNLVTDLAAKLNDVSDDDSPELGGNLDAQGHYIQNVPLQINSQTGTSYTIQLTDASKLVSFDNTSAITVTVPANSSTAFPVGSSLILYQKNTGLVSVSAGAGVTIRNANGHTGLSGQYASATLIKIDTDEWLLVGETS